MPSMRSVLLSLAGGGVLGDGELQQNTFSELQSAAITITRLRNSAGPSPPPDITNAGSIFGQSMPSGLALQRATMLSSQAAPNAPQALSRQLWMAQSSKNGVKAVGERCGSGL
jgi:hypothetical protein